MRTPLLGLIGSVAFSVSLAVALPIPTIAAPVHIPNAEQTRTDVQQVHHTYRHWKKQQLRAERRFDRQSRRYARRDRCRYYGDCYGRGYGFYDPPYYRRGYSRQPGVTFEFNLR